MSVHIRPLGSSDEAERCAVLMAGSEPWRTLGRDAATSLQLIQDPTREAFVAVQAQEISGFVVLCLQGAFTGYIQSIAVAAEHRDKGLGSQLLAFAEERIFGVSPNVFLCVSSFNQRARTLYERRGYRYVGELVDYLVRGHSELVFRKTLGPWSEFAIRRA